MSKEMMDALYVERNEKMGILTDNERERVAQVLGTDLTLVYDKKECMSYILVPLTKNHTFRRYGDSLEVDGKRLNGGCFFRKDGCWWIQITNRETLRFAV